jgi:hypothetical protein
MKKENKKDTYQKWLEQIAKAKYSKKGVVYSTSPAGCDFLFYVTYN